MKVTAIIFASQLNSFMLAGFKPMFLLMIIMMMITCFGGMPDHRKMSNLISS